MLGPVGRIMQFAGSIDRGLAEGVILENKGKRARADIDLVGWQKHAIQHELGTELMQREWDVLAVRFWQNEDGKAFETFREQEEGEEMEGTRTQDAAHAQEQEGGNVDGPFHPVVGKMRMDALGASTGE